MKFELPGFTVGPTDTAIEQFEERSTPVQRPSAEGVEAERGQAEAYGLTLEQFRAMRAAVAGSDTFAPLAEQDTAKPEPRPTGTGGLPNSA